MPHLRLAAAQLNTVVGDLSGNVERVLRAVAAAEAAGADICVAPELAIPGYPPEDLLLKPGFVADNVAALEKVAAATGQCAVVVGFVGAAPGGEGLANAAAVCAGGRVVGVYRKHFLPNYGVFDEQRWFVPGEEPPTLFGVAGAWVGVSICEDVWFDDGPVAQAGRAGADVVVNLNASPYNRGRHAERLAMLRGRVAEAGCAIAYVNQVGGQDELVFDGDSLIVGADGSLVASGAQFAEDLVVVDLPVGPHRPHGVSELVPRITVTGPGAPDRAPLAPATPRAPLGDHAEVYAALVLGTRDYLAKNGFTEAVDRPLGRHRLLAGGHGRRRRARARTACTACRCPRATRARGPGSTPRCWPSAWASISRSSPSRRRTSPSPPCSRRCSDASPPA